MEISEISMNVLNMLTRCHRAVCRCLRSEIVHMMRSWLFRTQSMTIIAALHISIIATSEF